MNDLAPLTPNPTREQLAVLEDRGAIAAIQAAVVAAANRAGELGRQ